MTFGTRNMAVCAHRLKICVRRAGGVGQAGSSIGLRCGLGCSRGCTGSEGKDFYGYIARLDGALL